MFLKRRELCFGEKGSLVVWTVLMMPFMFLLLALFVNLIVLVDSKIAMQGAVDRGVYAGSSYLSNVMNEVAGLNWKFRKEYLDKKKVFKEASNDSEKWIKEQIKILKVNQQTYLKQINHLLEHGYERAHQIAETIMTDNLYGYGAIKLKKYNERYGFSSEKMFEVGDDFSAKLGSFLNEEVLAANSVYNMIYDPEKKEGFSEIVKTYLKKADGYYVALAGSVEADFYPPLLPKFFTKVGSVRLEAFSAAAPYSGSIKRFSFTDSNLIEKALLDGRDYLYHTRFIPLNWVVGGVDAYH